jgi:F-actin monooxygenase
LLIRFSRNNVLHLWPYTINDLKSLGAKLFYGKFCAGSIDHISIRKLQCILLKIALLMGVQVYFNTSFEEIIEPIGSDTNNTGWRVKVIPENSPISQKCYDVIIGADGRRNSLPGFNRKEFRGRLAIGITANFINSNSAEEAEVQERSGVAFIFDQKFFLDLKQETGIDLENIVYYKDDTHYFVMTAKRQSLIEKGVIKQVEIYLFKTSFEFSNAVIFFKHKTLFNRISRMLCNFYLKKMLILINFAIMRKKQPMYQLIKS